MHIVHTGLSDDDRVAGRDIHLVIDGVIIRREGSRT
jgi:hypothetical protein